MYYYLKDVPVHFNLYSNLQENNKIATSEEKNII